MHRALDPARNYLPEGYTILGDHHFPSTSRVAGYRVDTTAEGEVVVHLRKSMVWWDYEAEHQKSRMELITLSEDDLRRITYDVFEQKGENERAQEETGSQEGLPQAETAHPVPGA